MVDGERQRVGGVEGLRQFGHFQHAGHHGLGLLFLGRTVAGDCQLHFVRRVLGDLASELVGRGEGEAARLGNSDGGANVGLEEDPLDDDDIGPLGGDEGHELAL